MKFNFFIIIVLLLIGCKHQKNKYLDIASNINQSIKLIEQQNSSIYSDFENNFNKDLYINQSMIPWNKKLNILKTETQKQIVLIDSIIDESMPQKIKGNEFQFEDTEISKFSGNLKMTTIKQLKDSIIVFKGFLKGLLSDKSLNQKILQSIVNLLTIDRWDNIKCLTSEKVSLPELVACLYKIKADIRLVENDLLNFIYSQVECDADWFYGMSIIVAPESKIIPLGKAYQAKIFPAFYDTTMTIEFEVDGNYFEAQNENAFYKQKIKESPGKYKKEGCVFYKKQTTNETQRALFKIEYEVLEKK